MTKSYVKDPNGKYRLTDKQEPIVMVNQQQSRPLSLEELDARLKRLERIFDGVLMVGAQR
jgi:hypothetical protein